MMQHHLALRRLHHAFHTGQIALVHPVLADRRIHLPQRIGRFGRHQQTACIAVQTVTDGRREALFIPWIICACRIEIMPQTADHTILHLCPVTLCAQTDRLVQDEHLRILIDDRQRLGNLQKGPVRLLLAQQLRRQKQLDHISFAQPLIDGTALAVDLDLLVADGLVQRAFGKRREHLHQKTVGALSLVIVVDDNFFHGDHLAIVYHIPEKMW